MPPSDDVPPPPQGAAAPSDGAGDQPPNPPAPANPYGPPNPYAPPDGPSWPARGPESDPAPQPPPPYGTRPGPPPAWPPPHPRTPPNPGGPAPGTPPEVREQNLGAVAMVLGLLAALLGFVVVPWLLLGPPALILGTRVRASAKAAGRRSGLATAGVVLALVGLAAAFCGYLYYRGPHERQQECLRASTTFAGDKACEKAFMDDLLHR